MANAIIRNPASGVNQTGIRDHNERLVLSLIQRHDQLASAEIARRSGLSPQTVSVIIRALEQDRLLLRGDPVRGKVGKPSVPMGLDPNGAHALGLKIGRRTSDLVVMDLSGALRQQLTCTYAYPTPDAVLGFVERGLEELEITAMDRIAGIGIAAPHAMWEWLETVRAPRDEMAAWRDLDLAAEVGARAGLATYLANDATSACAAEHTLGRGREFADYAYFYIGSFVGGGVVLNDAVYPGRTGNAGAFGTLPVRDVRAPEHQLIHCASIYRLERRLIELGRDATILWAEAGDWTSFDAALDPWLAETAHYLAVAAVAVASVIDFEAVLIDGMFPAEIRDRLVARVAETVRGIDTQGITPPRIEAGSMGRNAKAIGAAGLPIFSNYLLGPTGLGGRELDAGAYAT